MGGLSEVNIPVQELGGQRGEGAYFREDTVIPYSRKFLPGEIFAFVAPCSHGRTFYLAIFLSCTNDTEPMAITTAWVKIYFIKYLQCMDKFCPMKLLTQ